MYVIRKFCIKGKKESTVRKNLCVNANSKEAHARARTYTFAPLQTCILCVFEGQPQSRQATTWNKSSVFSSYVPALFSRALPNP